jgi:cytochrome c
MFFFSNVAYLFVKGFILTRYFKILNRFFLNQIPKMKKLFYLSLMLILVSLLSSCGKQEAKYDRPLDHWVFRSVMDSIPRVVTAALHEDVWIAYSAENGVLYKVWKGDVNFDGAVYTSAHGPQPTSLGDAWFVNQVKNPWTVVRNGKTEVPILKYDGHRFRNNQVEIMYSLVLNDGVVINIFEKPEAIIKDGVGLERTFTTSKIDDAISIIYETNISSVAMSSNVSSNGKWEVVKSTERVAKGLNGVDLNGKLTLKNNESTYLKINFTDKPLIIDERNIGKDEENTIPEGAKLIAKNDCRTCHNAYEQTVGPAYVDVAKRYETTDANIEMLVSKVINGGAGTWGTAAMTPHPELDKKDVRTMIEYVLSLDKDTEVKGSEGGFQKIAAANYMKPDVAATKLELLPGILAKAYTFNKPLNTLADVDWSKKPLYGGVLPQINTNAEDFKDLTERFSILYEGYLNIEKAGTYIFRIGSDDGSRVSIGDKVVINHDGLHGADMKDAAIGLEKGYHKLKIEFFQNGGGRAITFQYRTFEDGEFVLVPQTMMVHDAKKHSEIVGLSMPLAGDNTIPGDKSAVAGVHPSFDLAQARPSAFLPKVGGMDFLPDGRLVVCTWDPTGSVYVLSNLEDKDPEKIKVKRIAKGLAEPLGLKVVEGEIYVLQKQELTKLVDSDKDGEIDEYRTVSNQWKVSANFHEFSFGLVYKDEHFYAALATAILPGGASASPQIEDRGKVVQINRKTGATKFIASGLRTPNGIGIGADGGIFVADNQGDWLPSSKIVQVIGGEWFGSRSVTPEALVNKTETLPVVWLPQDEIGNSPSQPSVLHHGIYKGQMIHGEVTHGGIKRVFTEKVDGRLQGAVFRFIQGLEAGVNRLAWDNKNEQLYIGGIGNPGNWQHSGTNWFGLQKVKFNGKSTFEMLAIRAKSNGIEIEFTESIGERFGNIAADYDIKQWRYVPTENYGGPKVDEQKLSIKGVNISEDRKKVFLELDGMKAGHVLYVRLAGIFESAAGNELWSTESWYTMNAIPKNALGFKRPAVAVAPNMLTKKEMTDGWKLLFDGKSTKGWRNFKQKGVGSGWKVVDNALFLQADIKADNGWQTAGGGDIITNEEFENYELCLEWKIQNCGNSGIIYNVVEADKYDFVWQTGAEMQVLDNACHPDAKIRTHRAGDLYDMIECAYVTVKPAGEWNYARLVIKNGHAEHWLNGRKLVEFEMFNEEWRTRIKNSKFKDMPDFGTSKKGHIALQDHGDKVWYRNIRIKKLD